MGGKPSVGAWGDGGGGVGVAGEVVQVYKCTSHTMNAQTTQQESWLVKRLLFPWVGVVIIQHEAGPRKASVYDAGYQSEIEVNPKRNRSEVELKSNRI